MNAFPLLMPNEVLSGNRPSLCHANYHQEENMDLLIPDQWLNSHNILYLFLYTFWDSKKAPAETLFRVNNNTE